MLMGLGLSVLGLVMVAVSIMGRQLTQRLGFWRKEEWMLLSSREGRRRVLQQQKQ